MTGSKEEYFLDISEWCHICELKGHGREIDGHERIFQLSVTYRGSTSFVDKEWHRPYSTPVPLLEIRDFGFKKVLISLARDLGLAEETKNLRELMSCCLEQMLYLGRP